MIAPPKPLSRAELAAAGRRKLEEFRRAKAAAAAAKQNPGQPGPAKEQAAARELTSTSNGTGTSTGGDSLAGPATNTAAHQSSATITGGLTPFNEGPAVPFPAASTAAAQPREAAPFPPAPAAAAGAIPGSTVQPARLGPALVPTFPPPAQHAWGLQVASRAASPAQEPSLALGGESTTAGIGYTALTGPPSFAALRPPPPPFTTAPAARTQFAWQQHQVPQGSLYGVAEPSRNPLVPATTTPRDSSPKLSLAGESAAEEPADVPLAEPLLPGAAGPAEQRSPEGAAEATSGVGPSSAAAGLGVSEDGPAGSNSSSVVEQRDVSAAAHGEQRQQQGQHIAQGYQPRRPPPMPSLFDWRSALGRSQPAVGGAGAAATGKLSSTGREEPTREEPTSGQPMRQDAGAARSPSPHPVGLVSNSLSGSLVSGSSSSMPLRADPAIDLASAGGSGSSGSSGAPGPPFAPPSEGGSFAAALAAFTASGEEGGGKGDGNTGDRSSSDRSGGDRSSSDRSGQEPAWAQRLQSAGSRGGGLFSSLFGRKGQGPSAATCDGGGVATGGSSDGAAGAPAAAAGVPAGGSPSLPPALEAELSEHDATTGLLPQEGGTSPTKQRQDQLQQPVEVAQVGLAGSYGALADAYLAPQDAPAPARSSSPGAVTLPAASTAQHSRPGAAGGYAALADSYAAPAAVPATAAVTATGLGRATDASGTGRPAPKASSSSGSNSIAGGYSALSDAYLAPPPCPAPASQQLAVQSDSGSLGGTSHPVGAASATHPSTSANSRSSSFASGYAALSDKYAAPAPAGVSGGAQAPSPPTPLGNASAEASGHLGRSPLLGPSAREPSLGSSQLGQLPPLAAPAVHRPPVTPAPSQASLAAQGAGAGAATGDTAAAAAAAAAPGALPETTGASSRAASVGAERQGGSAWSAPPPLPPRVPSASDVARFTPPPSRGNDFKALQQHIDELTQEKFTLQRGLEQQSRLAGSLADENEALAQRHNEQAKQVDALERDVAQLHQQLTEQAMLVERAAAERDAYKLSAQEAQARAQSLAAEVVRLEESVLRLRSQEIRVGREAEGATEVMRAMQSQLESLTRERSGLLTQLDGLRNDNAELRMALRAAEAAAAAPPPPAAAMQGAGAAAAGQHAGQPAAAAQPSPQQQAEASEQPAAHAKPQQQALPHAARDVAGPLARDALAQHAQQALPHASEDDDDDEDDVQRERAASVLPPELLALLPSRVAAAAAGGGYNEHLSQGANGTAASFATGDSVLALVQSIYMLLGALEADKRELLGTLGSKQDEVSELQDANTTLHSRLEASQQRIELLSQQLLRLGGGRQKGGTMQQQVLYANGSGGSNGKANGKTGWGWGGTQTAAVARRPGLQYLS